MGRPKGEGKDSRYAEREYKGERESKFADKEYKDVILDLFNSTSARQSDFDVKAVLLVDTMHQKGKAKEAVAYLKTSLHGIERDKIGNWRAYVYTLLRGFDEESYKAMKDASATKLATAKRRPGKGEGRTEAVVGSFTFNPNAVEFVPGVPLHGSGPSIPAPPTAAPVVSSSEAPASEPPPDRPAEPEKAAGAGEEPAAAPTESAGDSTTATAADSGSGTAEGKETGESEDRPAS